MNKQLIAVVVCLSISGSSFAGDWKQDHPRRAEVNSRLNNQNRRIKDGVEDGKLTKAQAQQLHQEDHSVRQQERAMAAQNGGHITKTEQRQLNQEENQVSKQIYEEKHPAVSTKP
jgi:hypothetical protein